MTSYCALKSTEGTHMSGYDYQAFTAFIVNEYPTVNYDFGNTGRSCDFVVTPKSEFDALIEQQTDTPAADDGSVLTTDMTAALIGGAIALYCLVAVINSVLMTMGYKR